MLEASLSADVLDVVSSYLEVCDLVSSFALASRTLAGAVDECAARRCRALWTTSAECEERGLRLGSAFLARRSRPMPTTMRTLFPDRPPHKTLVPLASRPLEKLPEEQELMSRDWADDDESDALEDNLRWAKEVPTTRTLEGRFLLIDVTVKTRYGVVVGRRSFLMDAPLTDDRLHFDEPLTIAEDLEPDFFYREYFSNVDPGSIQNGWYFEFGNVVGGRTKVLENKGEITHSLTGICDVHDEIQHDFPEQLMAGGYIDELRPSQLPSRRRVVSVRIDLFRQDGKSMCLLDNPVGVPGCQSWQVVAFQGWASSDHIYPEDPDEHRDCDYMQLTYENSDQGQTLFPDRDGDAFDTFHCAPTVLAEYPENDDRGALRLVGLRLEFVTSTSDPNNGMEGSLECNDHPHVGAKVIQALLALDAWA